MALGLLAVMGERFYTKKGIGVRVIQLLSIIFLIPAIIFLSIDRVITGETVGTLIGAIIGYILSGLNRDEKKTKAEKKAPSIP